MQLHGMIPVVDVTINGKGPFKMMIDTGAGATVVNDDLVKELGIPVTGKTKIGDPADPQGITADTVLIDRLDIGGVSFSKVNGVSWDRSQLRPGADAPRGILGLPLFADRLLTLNYPERKVLVGEGALPAANGADIVTYQPGEADLVSVPISVAGTTIGATLDSGASSKEGLGFPMEHMDTLPLVAKPVEIGRGRMAGGEVVIYGATLNGAVVVGGHTFDGPAVHFNGRLRHVNLGAGLLSQFAVTLDQKHQRIRFEFKGAPPPAPASAPKAGTGDTCVGTFGERQVSREGDALYLQRITGPRGMGPKMRLISVTKDEFTLEGVPAARVKCVRGSDGSVTALSVLGPSGEWETAGRSQP
jgi:hypothetical protein